MWFTPSSTSLSPMCDQSVRHRAIDSSELRLTTDRESRQVGQQGRTLWQQSAVHV